jgi:hypothetical protein
MSDKKRRLNKLSLASFILGILIFCINMSWYLRLIILAVSLGYLARRQIKESGFLQKGIIFANLGIFLGLLSLFVVLNSFLFGTGRVREQLHRGVCMTNLKSIGEALYFYASDYNTNFPDKLSLLYPNYIPKPELFWCPSDKDPKPTMIDNDMPDGKNSTLISYQYDSGHKDNESPLIPIVWDNGCDSEYDNHGTDGGNVLYLSGSVQWRPGSSGPPGNKFWKSRKHGQTIPSLYQ